jgi:anion-transporting  ArsA/GET3 family ATPase
MASSVLESALARRRALVCAGAGGVGKTTLAAALALAAAKSGRRALCLTIDPAQRLATSLGLDSVPGEARELPVDELRNAGIDALQSLSVMMVDAKQTFDDLVRRHASSPEARDRVLDNQVYRYVSEQLAGTQAYMAMEQVLRVLQDPRYETIILDTPPTAHALDFLDAPHRLVELVDNPALGGLARLVESSGRFSLGLLARGVRGAFQAMSRITGIGFIERVSEFVAALNELFGGFRERAERVAASLHSEAFGYVLVASPAAFALEQAHAFALRLREHAIEPDALVLNRVEALPAARPGAEQVRAAMSDAALSLAPGAETRVLQALEEQRFAGRRDHDALAALGTRYGSAIAGLPRVTIPAFTDDVHGLSTLDRMASLLLAAPEA